MEEQTTENKNQAFHSFEEKNKNNSNLAGSVVFLIILLALGLGIGYMAFKATSSLGLKTINMTASNSSKTKITKGMVFGVNDISSFPDSAEGVLQKGGINNEGQYHLVRPGGPSQYVYLTSSTVDLSLFINHKVKVNGATQTAQTAGWLMDVGRVEVEN